MKKWVCLVALMVLSGVLAGCVTGSGGGDTGALAELKAEAAAMGRADLEAMIAKYKNLIAEKIDLVDVLKGQLSKIPVAEMMGEKASGLRKDIEETTSLIGSLKEKLAVYMDAFKTLQ